jgi:hypothetical protein
LKQQAVSERDHHIKAPVTRKERHHVPEIAHRHPAAQPRVDEVLPRKTSHLVCGTGGFAVVREHRDHVAAVSEPLSQQVGDPLDAAPFLSLDGKAVAEDRDAHLPLNGHADAISASIRRIWVAGSQSDHARLGPPC